MIRSGDMLPHEIEGESFAILTRELGGRTFSPEEEPVIKRVIHTTADFDYADNLYFSPGAVELARAALAAGATIITDTQMARSGINKKAVALHGGQVLCFMDDEEVARTAKEGGTTRAVASVNRAADCGPTASLWWAMRPPRCCASVSWPSGGSWPPGWWWGCPWALSTWWRARSG